MGMGWSAGRVTQEPFGAECDGMQASLYTLTSSSGVKACVTDYGASLTHLFLPDAKGELADCVLGFDDLAGYRGNAKGGNQFFGCTVGRVAGRISGAQFKVNGEVFKLAANNGPNAHHGGRRGFDKAMWQATVIDVPGCPAMVRMCYTSPDGEEGYPGECRAQVTYSLSDDGELRIDMECTVSRPCPINLCNHSYFNLAGHDSGPALDHKVHINADKYTPIDAKSLPTGAIAPVAGTPFDFTATGSAARTLGERIGQLTNAPGTGGGYDHNYALRGDGHGKLALAATLADPKSGRALEVYTNLPGMNFYSSNYVGPSKEGCGLDAELVSGKGGALYNVRQGICLETQHFTDSINQPKFPSSLVLPGETYVHSMLLRFSAS